MVPPTVGWPSHSNWYSKDSPCYTCPQENIIETRESLPETPFPGDSRGCQACVRTNYHVMAAPALLLSPTRLLSCIYSICCDTRKSLLDADTLTLSFLTSGTVRNDLCLYNLVNMLNFVTMLQSRLSHLLKDSISPLFSVLLHTKIYICCWGGLPIIF